MGVIFFDLDGTLLDTAEDIRYHINKTLSSRGYPQLDGEQVRAFIGDGAKKLVERALPEGATDTEECYRQFLSRFEQSDGALIKLFPGEEEALSELKGKGYRFAVITNKPHLATLRCLGKFFREGYFEFIGGDSGAFPVKPDPSLTRYAALSMRVPLKECVFVGDGETDVRTARNAGVGCVSALWGYRSEQALRAAGALRFARDFPDLARML